MTDITEIAPDSAPESDTQPDTLASIAVELDREMAAVAAIRDEFAEDEQATLAALDERRAQAKGLVAQRETNIRTLAARQTALMRASFGDIVSFDSPRAARAARRPSPRHRSTGTPAPSDRNRQIREWAVAKGLQVAPSGKIPAEVLAAYEQAAEYRG